TGSACGGGGGRGRPPCPPRPGRADGRGRSRSGWAGRTPPTGRSGPWTGWSGTARSTPAPTSDPSTCASTTAGRAVPSSLLSHPPSTGRSAAPDRIHRHRRPLGGQEVQHELVHQVGLLEGNQVRRTGDDRELRVRDRVVQLDRVLEAGDVVVSHHHERGRRDAGEVGGRNRVVEPAVLHLGEDRLEA